MKLRNLFIVLLAVFMVFAFASCKNDPEPTPPGPTPPGPTGETYQVEITEGVDKDYYNRDKLKFVWGEAVEEGDVITLKYRSERGIYQWDIRDENSKVKWVYETDKNGFVDPVLGEDGWYTLTYRLPATDINGAEIDYDAIQQFGIYFRGNFVTTDLFEIKDITLNGYPLEVESGTIISKAKLNEEPVEHDWTKKNYAVLFATGKPGAVDKTPIAEKVVEGGKVTGAPIAKEGYTLKIFNDEEHTSVFDPETPITKEMIFYYEYIPINMTVKFVTNSESVIEDQLVPYNSAIIAPEPPVKAGLIFKAWNIDEALTTPWIMTDPVLSDMVLYASYGEPVLVKFELNGGAFPEGVPSEFYIAKGNLVDQPVNPEKADMMFSGWYADSEYKAEYSFAEPVEAATTIYAKWTLGATVTLKNYDSKNDMELDVGLGVKIDAPETPVVPGLIFKGWFDDEEFMVLHDFDKEVAGSFTIYAKWTEGTIYRVTSKDYTSSDGNSRDKMILSLPTADVKPGDVISLTFRTTEPFKQYSIRRFSDNKKFFHEKSSGTYPLFFSSMTTGEDGWTTVSYAFPAEGAATQDAAAAVYPKDAETGAILGVGFNVYFRNQKMVPDAFMEIKAVAINGVEVNLTEDNFNPAGSLGNVESTLEVVPEDYDWIPHTVTFETNGGSEIAPATVDFGRYVAEPEDPIKAGVKFYGWYVDTTLETPFSFDTPIIRSLTIYAKYVDPVTVTFDTDGGSAIEPVTVAKGYPVDKPTDPTKEGVKFGGWFIDKEFTTAYDFDSKVEADLTIYAKWLSVYTVTLNYNDGTGKTKDISVPMSTGEIAASDLRAGNPGYYLDGWYDAATGGKKVEKITDDCTIYAHWTAPDEYTRIQLTFGDGASTGTKRMDLRYTKDYVNPVEGDIITFVFRAKDNLVTQGCLREAAASKWKVMYWTSFPSHIKSIGDGWYECVIEFGKQTDETSAKDIEYPLEGFRLELGGDGGEVYLPAGFYVDFLAFAYNGQALDIVGTEGKSGSAHGPYKAESAGKADITKIKLVE
jgi:uncharacterized repeat protein (TIGR02543 family)